MAGGMNFFILLLIVLHIIDSRNVNDFTVEAPLGIDVSHEDTHHQKTSVAGPIKSANWSHSSAKPSTEQLGYHELARSSNILVPSHASNNHLEVFCYRGEEKRLQTFFKTVEVHLDIKSSSYRYYESSNASEVRKLYADSSWFSFSPWRPTTFRLELHNESCVGIETSESYRVLFRVRVLDLWRVCALCVGVLVFSGAHRLARNIVLHYLSGSLVGVLGSFLIILFLLAKFIPKRTGALSFMVGGSGLFLYLLQVVYSNFVYLIEEYYTVFLGYIAVTGILSFGAVYRWGPIVNNRSLQLVQWSLQCCGLAAVYCSSQYREATLAIVLLLLAYHNTPHVVMSTAQSVWRRRFPPAVRLMTEEEFISEGNTVTAASLEELRTYCQSPNCNAWKTFSRLQTPNRFAEFVNGSSHLLDDEIIQYEHSDYLPTMDLTDEDNMTDDD